MGEAWLEKVIEEDRAECFLRDAFEERRYRRYEELEREAIREGHRHNAPVSSDESRGHPRPAQGRSLDLEARSVARRI